MRILFITAASHTPNQSGYNHFQRVEYLSRHADLTLWACKGADFAASAGPRTAIARAALPGKLGLFLHTLASALSGSARGFDIVLTEPSLLSALGLLCKVFGARKWVVDVWDVPARMAGKRSRPAIFWLRVNRFLLKQSFRFADLFLLSIRPDYEFTYFGIARDRMLLMKNAIRADEFPALGPQPVSPAGFDILCTRSSYHSDMGLDTMAEAYRLLRAAGEDVSLTIVGRIPDALRGQVASIEADPNVTFFTALDKDALKSRIAASGVCVVPFKDVPDLAQTYPIKVLEYMALGRPVIVSQIGGMSELIDNGRTGLYFRAGDAGDLAGKIRLIRNDAALARRLGADARSASLAYDYAAKGRAILAALRALCTR